jgi:CHAT domain-containing protein
LVIDHEIISLPSASTLAVLRNEVKNRRPAEKTVTVFADPVFERSDSRFTQSSLVKTASNASRVNPNLRELMRSAKDSGVLRSDLTIPRLPGTRREAERILLLAPAQSTKHAFDFEANRSAATSSQVGQYRFVHFATHGFLDSQNPELSGILLSMFDEHGQPQDGFLRAHEIFNLRLPVEMVVLSACETALGKDVKGEGVVSLTRGFMYAGASRVVVSLWSVSDESTAELMVRFYKGILQERLRPAQALQVAQISLLKDKQFGAPFYWAAFTLQGEWR